MQDILATVTATLAVIAGILFISFILAWPTMALWNGCLVDAVSGVREIGWLQAWGLQFLFNILFKTTVTTKK